MRDMKKISIKECCASCRLKAIENDGSRVCQLMQIVVRQQMKCPKWDMADGLANMGSSQGVIKRREYLMFVFEVRMQGCDDTLDALRKRFEAETGLSPFVIH